jgi:hypothetical protein
MARLKVLMTGLRDRGRLPLHIDVTKIGAAFAASVYDAKPQELLPESVATGISLSSDTALIKALVEFVERKALWEGGAKGIEPCLTERSDGTAAFPLAMNLRTRALSAARSNAYCEAVERFVWSKWWDDPDTHFSQQNVTNDILGLARPLIDAIDLEAKIRRLRIVEPTIESNSGIRVLILLAELHGGGCATGGAAGPKNSNEVIFRASSELLRHVLAIARIKRGHKFDSFYERRLAYFGLGRGDDLVRNRMNSHGLTPIKLPPLKFDTTIPHELDHLVAVHRCYFENQPAFVGGTLERLCI